MYIIELITKDAPYISLGYWGNDSKITTSLSSAMRIESEEDARAICHDIKQKYNGRKYIYAMPWVYGITKDGKLGRRFYELEK
jgi:hypothetical protein